MMPRPIHIRDDGSLHRYRTEIPNTFIRGKRSKGLSPQTKWLYVYLKSVAGDTQECWQSTTTLAEGAGLSRMSVSRARQELVRHGLITLTPGPRKNRDAMHIRIVDIWAENMQEFSAGPVARLEEEETVTTPQCTTQVPQSTTQIHQSTTQVHQQSVDIPDNSSFGVPHRYSGVPHRYSGVPNMTTKKIPIRRSQEEKEKQLLSHSANGTSALEYDALFIAQEQSTDKASAVPLRYSPGFEQFWSVWRPGPRKTKKVYCFKLWKRRGLEPRAAEICTKVAAWHETEQWRTGFEPMPGTWLFQSQYDDEVPTASASARRGLDMDRLRAVVERAFHERNTSCAVSSDAL